MKNKLISILILLYTLFNLNFCYKEIGKITINEDKFLVENSTKIFMIGANTPWNNRNDFGSNFNETFWKENFENLHKNSINSVRVFISCNGLNILIGQNGTVLEQKDELWKNIDTLLRLAEENELYVMATLMSYEFFVDQGQPHLAWRKIFDNNANMDSLIKNYLMPFVTKFKSYHSMWSIDLCNEPDLINEEEKCGMIQWDKINTLFAKEIVAIHDDDNDILVTIGYQSKKYTTSENYYNFCDNNYFKNLIDDERAFLDFCSIHFYEWESEFFDFPFDQTPKNYGIDVKKPIIISSFSAKGFTTNTKNSKNMSGSRCYIELFLNNWNGAFAFSSNGVDEQGSLINFFEGTIQVAAMMAKNSEEDSSDKGDDDDNDDEILGKVQISGISFAVDEYEIFMNGANTPWHDKNDFGGIFIENMWNMYFKKLKKSNINSVRIFVSYDGKYINISDEGKVIGPTQKFWDDIKTLLSNAEKYKIYVMATLMTYTFFDVQSENYGVWRKIFDSDENMDSLVNNYVVPFVTKNTSNSLWSVDLFNEPELVNEKEECGKISWENITTLLSKCAKAIHENSDILVTIGFGNVKYNSKKYDGNYGGDSFLKSFTNNKNSYIDFYSTHYYEWQAELYGFPFDTDRVRFGLDGTKPAIIGSFPGIGFFGNVTNSKNMTGSDCYMNAYRNGWNGIMAWSSNGVDNSGSLDDFYFGAFEVNILMETERKTGKKIQRTQNLGKIKKSGISFVLDDKEIFMNGVNVPWDKKNDFGGEFDKKFWDVHFSNLNSYGINSARVFMSFNGLYIDIASDGEILGPTSKFWQDIDDLFKVADNREIYIMATLLSNENFKKGTFQPYEAWRKIFENENNMDSLINYYIIPFVNSFKRYNALWSIDIFNEPEVLNENEEYGKIPWENINTLLSKCAKAIHENSDILVTIGFGNVKYNSKKYDGNYGGDSFLKSFTNNKNSYIDFYSTHYYEWQAELYGFPFDTDRVRFGLDGTKPAIIGSFPGIGFFGNVTNSKFMTGADCYMNAYINGWNGIMAWSSNGVDNNGTFNDFRRGARNVANKMKNE